MQVTNRPWTVSHAVNCEKVLEIPLHFITGLQATPGPVFYLHSSLLKLSKLWDPNFSFNYVKQIHFLSQSFENLLKQGT